MNKIYGLDLRSLTRFRQIVSLLYLFFFFLVRFLYFEYYSVSAGPFSNAAMEAVQNTPLLVHLLPGDLALNIFLIAGSIPGLMLFFGILPSLASFLCCGLYILSARRFLPYYYGTDEIMIVFLFILGVVYLADPGKYADEDNYISVRRYPLILLLLVQLAIIYFFNGVNKTHMNWWSGEAVRMTLFNVQFNRPLALSAVDLIGLNKFFTYATLAFECLFPLLLFFPFRRPESRLLTGILLVLFHWGIGLFADVTMYKFMGIAFLVLLVPGYVWDRLPGLKFQMLDQNIRLRNLDMSRRTTGVLTTGLALIFMAKAVVASVDRQNERYRFIGNEQVIRLLDASTSRTYSPFRQYWFMFAPTPPTRSGYIAFEYTPPGGRPENINIYGNAMPRKDFRFYHPLHVCTIVQFSRVSKGVFPEESQFILTRLFEHAIQKDINRHPDRLTEDYSLVLYDQEYGDFLAAGHYEFQRTVLASYE